jgi:DNA-binding transcriptional ArsR family regulator
LRIVAAVGDVFRALADPTRRTILDELSERDGQTLFEICTRLAMKHGLGSSRQAISLCTSNVSRSSRPSALAAVLVACSSMARTMPSRRRLFSWSRVCSFNIGGSPSVVGG